MNRSSRSLPTIDGKEADSKEATEKRFGSF